MGLQTSTMGAPAMETLVESYKEKQRALQTNYDSRSQLLVQQQENEVVEKEFAVLESDATVYKLVGPVLVKQSIGDAQANVGKRLSYISEEIERADKVIVGLEKELEDKKNELQEVISKQQEAAAAGGAA